VWTGFIWLRVGTSGRFLWTHSEESLDSTKTSNTSYTSTFQIMDRTSGGGWETEICWTESSATLWSGTAARLETTVTLSGESSSWPQLFRHLIVPPASRHSPYWPTRCNHWWSTGRHCSVWTSSPATSLVWFMNLKACSAAKVLWKCHTKHNLNLLNLNLCYHKYW
jgi:hypothetical protein